MAKNNRRNSSVFIGPLLGLLSLLLNLIPGEAAVHPVFTYKNASTTLGQLVTSSTLVWETYDPKDANQLQYAVEGGKFITEDQHYPIYVCRVTIDGVPTSGHTEKIMQKHVCVAAHNTLKKYNNFEVLINKGHLGKVYWRHWRKFNAGIPIGAIRIGEEAYIARHRTPEHQHPNQDNGEVWGADYNLGRLEPVGLGKIKVIENEADKDYDEGEVLVETEPYRYELRDIKISSIRSDIQDNITELASKVMMNNGDKYSTVETVLSYQFDHYQYWGTYEGVARGLPTKIYEKDVSVPTEINWGLKYSIKRFETKSVQTKLWPGTALNVTLKGNYVILNAPYTAKLVAFYYGSDDTVSRKISAEVRKGYLKDVKLEFSPVYWIENGTIVPTTTTTTTSTTSTTTHPTTTTTKEAQPIDMPPSVHIEHVGAKFSGPDPMEKSILEPISSNEVLNGVPENYAEQKTALAGFGHTYDANANAGDSLVRSKAFDLLTILIMTYFIGSL